MKKMIRCLATIVIRCLATIVVKSLAQDFCPAQILFVGHVWTRRGVSDSVQRPLSLVPERCSHWIQKLPAGMWYRMGRSVWKFKLAFCKGPFFEVSCYIRCECWALYVEQIGKSNSNVTGYFGVVKEHNGLKRGVFTEYSKALCI